MLPAEIVRQVRRIQLRTGRQVADVLAGAYVSVFRGRGVEFDEVRPYIPGDDVRTIDWNVTARVGTPFVKRYIEERQLTVLLLVDMSASLDFGSAHRSKREAAVEFSALVAFSAIYNDDKVGLLLFHRDVDEYIPPRKGQKHALRVVREVLARGQEESVRTGRGPRGMVAAALTRLRAARERLRRQSGMPRGRRGTDIAHALEFCRRVLPRRAVLFLVTDFLDTAWIDAVRGAARKHDVVAVRVTDRREAELAPAGLVTLRDAETGAERLIDSGDPAFQRAYREDAVARGDALRRDLRASGIDLIDIDASGSVVDPLLAFLRMRERRNRR
ncbi:MAG: DUF58 domain-containing protein [Gammaproteobacteria bacterium]|nr:DUF58 domain-containing protein [Gammaproteobacteria bacterium]